jgi:hypothetical protein
MLMAAEPGETLLTGVKAGRCEAWRSPDGLAWAQIINGCPMDRPARPLVAGPSEFVVAETGGSSSTPGQCQLTYARPNLYFCAPLIEISATGEAWTDLRAPTPDGEVIAASANEILWGGVEMGSPSSGTGLAQSSLWIADVQTSR